MLVLYAKYAFIFWLVIGSNHGDILLMRQLSEDDILLNVAACTKRCLRSQNIIFQQVTMSLGKSQEKYFRKCVDDCKNRTDRTPKVFTNLSRHQVQENFHLQMVCHTDVSLTFRIDWVNHSHVKQVDVASNDSQEVHQVPDALYIIKLNAVEDSIEESSVYLSDDNFFTVPDLKKNISYNVTALAVHADAEYSIIAKEQTFNTLKGGYQPSQMGVIRLKNYLSKSNDMQHIAAKIEWAPSSDQNCFYHMIYYSTDTQNLDTPLPLLFRYTFSYTIEALEFGHLYQVGVRAVNLKNSLESPMKWLDVQTPTCQEWHQKNLTLCVPLRPSNLSVLQYQLKKNIYSLNITWSRPEYAPDFYTLHILDLYKGAKAAEIFRVLKNANYLYIPSIEIHGKNFEVHLVAHNDGGKKATAVFVDTIFHIEREEDGGLNMFLLYVTALLFCIIGLFFLPIRKCKAKLNEYRNHESKGQKTTQSLTHQLNEFHLSLIENSGCISADTNQNKIHDDDYEVEPHTVTLQGVLGEGAFGLVRRGIYKRSQVAVKLLKDEPSEEDIKAFKSEIKVLKSVGKHPNIVGIVGYSTNPNRMMLLIEYCSLGNLQNFLRDEWKLRQEKHFQDTNKTRQSELHEKLCLKTVQLQVEDGIRIEEVNMSLKEAECGSGKQTIAVETYSLTQPASKRQARDVEAADNKSYGLYSHLIENIDNNSTHLATNVEAILCRRTEEFRKKMRKKPIVSIDNREYLGLNLEKRDFFTPFSAQERLKYVDLLDIAEQVALGMEFLAQNKVVHRDLAARNVLIALDRSIKIADFGLSRDVYHESVYRKSGGGKLPIKWLALESLTHQVYTSQSDVWSFGILLYEIATFGGMPYPSISPNDLLPMLRKGQRMKRPEGCSSDMFTLMESCWCAIPAQRPTFSLIKNQLAALILATGELPQRQKQQEHCPQTGMDDQNVTEIDQYLQPLP